MAKKDPVSKGTFSIYSTRGGGYRLYFRLEGADQDEHFDLPGALVAIARMKAKAFGGSGSPLEALGMLDTESVDVT